eukprot:Colp12_sorted_trinity150504_noHs@27196
MAESPSEAVEEDPIQPAVKEIIEETTNAPMVSQKGPETRPPCCVCLEQYDTVLMHTQTLCECAVCKGCMSEYVRAMIMSGMVLDLPCPSCERALEHSEIESIAGKDLFLKFETFSHVRTLARNPNTKWCPTPDCNTALEATVGSITTKCPTCKVEICASCWANHGNMGCEEYQKKKKKADRKLERKFKKWKKAASRCPTCKAVVEKMEEDNGGNCNHMICTLCTTEFCYLCGRAIPPIGHFERNNVFGCPGLQYAQVDAGARLPRLKAKTKVVGRISGKVAITLVAMPVVLAVALPISIVAGVYIAQR